MIRSLLERLTKILPPPRVIWDRKGQTPYLSRHYLVGRPRMRDGSQATDETGHLRPGVVFKMKNLGVYLHHFHRGDDEPELHNHPWRWSVALILAGGYLEERRLDRRCFCGHDRTDHYHTGTGVFSRASFAHAGPCKECNVCPQFRGEVIRQRFRPGMINIIRADDYHRVDLLEHDAWTLFIAGPKVGTWGFWNRKSGRFLHWRLFINELRDPEAYQHDNLESAS